MKVFDCQHCTQPFQAGPEAAGKQLRCPACNGLVAIPSNAFDQPSAASASPGRLQVFACPGCEGQFQVAIQAAEQTVACPHCNAGVRVPGHPASDSDVPSINTKPKRRGGTSPRSHRGAAFVPPDDDPNRFAPGFQASVGQPPSSQSNPKQTSPKSAASDQPSESKPSGSRKKKLALPKPPGKPGRGPASTGTRGAARVPSPSDLTKRTSATTLDSPASPAQSAGGVSLVPQPIPPGTSSDPSPSVSDVPNLNFRQSIDHLLPPKFLVDDPDQLAVKVSRNNHKILLPDGRGGTAQIDRRVVRVQHGDDTVSLVVLTPQQKARRRMIRNAITILVAIVMMAAAFWLLT